MKINKARLIKQLFPFWKTLQRIEAGHVVTIQLVEKMMAGVTGIKDIEFFKVDGDWVGIGNASRTMPLLHDDELERVGTKRHRLKSSPKRRPLGPVSRSIQKS